MKKTEIQALEIFLEKHLTSRRYEGADLALRNAVRNFAKDLGEGVLYLFSIKLFK